MYWLFPKGIFSELILNPMKPPWDDHSGWGGGGQNTCATNKGYISIILKQIIVVSKANVDCSLSLPKAQHYMESEN